ncbi:hypothetical protein [Rhizobium sp. Root708]|uniref:hypothetical protein n=1 Tax=Rhizobium sp. Root708 TaxID=1736592 RepID=UPI000AEE6F85|nr:hypothetical protein [Rhizobium sp. Root708]
MQNRIPFAGSTRQRFALLRLSLLYGIGVACLFAFGAAAQAPTDEQRNAIRSACRSDFIAKCSGVQPGGIEALTCLQQHDATLAPACKKAVSAISTKPKSSSAQPTQTGDTAAAPPAPAAPQSTSVQPTQAQRNAVKSACQRDFMAQCPGVQPGGQHALSCLQQQSAKLSAPCQQAVSAISTTTGSIAAPSANAATAPATPKMAMPTFSPREEVVILRDACGPDFRSLCRMVPLGGGRGIACLRDNIQRVSPGCHRVLTSGL